MNISIKKAQVKGKIKAIPSKSFAHRILICDFLANNPIKIEFDGFFSKDISATANCLKAIKSGKRILDCIESGSTLRFLLPLCCALGGEYSFIGQGRLLDRPNFELFDTLSKHGVIVDKKEKSIETKGKLTAGEYFIRGDISSQYISGLLMALPILDGDSKIVLTTALSSKPYVDITISVLRNFGIEIQEEKWGYVVKGNQRFIGQSTVEGDWSNMAFFLVLGATAGECEVDGLNLDSLQGDKKILDILKSANARLELFSDRIIAKKSDLIGFSMDADDCPDLVPICAVLGALAKGKTVIKKVERLKIKESDRIKSTMEMLSAFEIKSEFNGKDLIIFGGQPKGASVNSYNDHRIAMASAILACSSDGESQIIDALAVQKSYPTFFQDFNSVGGITSEI